MSTSNFHIPDEQTPIEDPNAGLERVFIKEYLAQKGYRWCELTRLEAKEIKRLMTDACMYASTKLANIEAKADFREHIVFRR